MQIGESVAPPALGLHDDTCPFCEGKDELQLRNYKTKHGALKEEDVLGHNLGASGTITADRGKNNVGNVYPLSGGDQPHDGWTIREQVLMEFEVWMKATPHHLIPGKASMRGSRLENWTREDQGKIKQDIGYSIDCAQNGIWLPYLPSIYTIKHVSKTVKQPMNTYYGTRWEPLHSDAKHDIAYMIMSETWLQFHYTDHDAPYHHIDSTENYDGNAQARCNLLADVMETFWKDKCPKAKDDDKFFPPYGLVERINLQSEYMKQRITGKPSYWREWVTDLAQDFTHDLLSETVKLSSRFFISRK
jgi:hypothetical protein